MDYQVLEMEQLQEMMAQILLTAVFDLIS